MMNDEAECGYTVEDVETTTDKGQIAFVRVARAQTMLKDFNALRKAISSHDTFATEAAWDNCERWVSQLDVRSKHD